MNKKRTVLRLMAVDFVKAEGNKGQVYNNILIIKLSSLGDICHALPSLTALRKLYPQARISWAVNKPFADLLIGHPLLDEVLVIDQKALTQGSLMSRYRYFQELRQQLQQRDFDLMLDLQGLFKSSVIALMTGCKTRYGYWEMREGSALITKGIKGAYANAHVIQRYLDVIRFLGSDVREPEFVLPEISKEKAEIAEKLFGFDNYVVLAPGTSWSSKEWPLDNYAELGKRLLQDGYQLVLIGGSIDTDKSKYILDNITETALANKEKIIDLTGQTSLKQLMAVCQAATLYISGDTGPLHVAVTTGVPIIALYGPTMPHRTGPYVGKMSGNNKSVVLSGKAACTPCRKRECSTRECMSSIGVDEVYDKVKQLSSGGQAVGKR